MINIDKTRSVLNRIAHAKDPLGLMRELVLESGGTWIDAATVDMAFLFEVNLHGVRGFGLGASAAIDNWIANAEDAVASEDKASAHKTRGYSLLVPEANITMDQNPTIH
jgi:hypothetical protein